MRSGCERRSVVVRRGSCESRPCCAKRILFRRARRVRRTARARPNRVHEIWAARADQFDASRFLPGARVYINHYAFLSFGAGPRGCIVRFPESENESPRWNHERCYAASRFDCCRHGLGRIRNYLAGFAFLHQKLLKPYSRLMERCHESFIRGRDSYRGFVCCANHRGRAGTTR